MIQKIISWNILAHEFVDYASVADDYPNISIVHLQDRASRLARIQATIATHAVDADIILLQEVMTEEAGIISAQLAGSHTAYCGPSIVWDADKFTNSGNLTLVRHGLFSQAPECIALPFKDGGTWILRSEQDGIAIANVHLLADEPCEGHPEAPTTLRRTDQITQVVAQMTPYPLAIIGGDFNEAYDLGCPLYQQLEAAGFTSHITEPTFVVEPYVISIDQISTRGCLRCLPTGRVISQAVNCRDAAAILREFGSDHQPICLQLD